jgi:hypothetical protein
MRKISFVLLACAAAVFAADRPGQITAGFAYRDGGVLVRYAMTIEPPLRDSQLLLLGSGVHTTHDRMHRFVVDKASGTYFGYDLMAEPVDGGKSFRVTIEPLSIGPEGEHWIPRDMPLRPAPLPKYPPVQVVQAGDTLALDLLISPDGRQRVVDYLEFDRNGGGGPVASTGATRDFTLDDGPLTIRFQHPVRVSIGGRVFAGRTSLNTAQGGTLWFAFPNRGRDILSLAPHEGFQKAGWIRGNVLSFQSDGEQYEVRAAGPIVGWGGAWNLYVLHDPLYLPRESEGPTIFGGTGRLENLIPQR